MSKRLTSVVLLAALLVGLLFTLSACGRGNDSQEAVESSQVQEADTATPEPPADTPTPPPPTDTVAPPSTEEPVAQETAEEEESDVEEEGDEADDDDADGDDADGDDADGDDADGDDADGDDDDGDDADNDSTSAVASPATVDFTVEPEIPANAAYAVDLLEAWIAAGAPETDPFDYTGHDGETYTGVYDVDIQPLFGQENIWFLGAASCNSCHHDNLENSYHEMDLSSHAGIMAGADGLEEPPGVPILGQSAVGEADFDWGHAKLRSRLRNNRMPPGMPFDITEANRDGPAIDVNGTEIPAVNLIAAWVEAGAPESDAFGDDNATFDQHIQPLFTETNLWYDDAPSCTSCHHANLENSYHEMDLSSYEGIMAGADRMEEPPGVPLLGQSAVGETDFDWEHSKLRERLRDNRMPPGMPFDITEANRDGPLVLHGEPINAQAITIAQGPQLITGDCHIESVNLINMWVATGAGDGEFSFSSREDEPCIGDFETDVLPLFADENIWYPGAPSCASCHHDNLENSYHEMDLTSHEGIIAGADILEEPPGVPILGQSAVGESDFDWDHSKLRERMRNNRMPPAMPFDITEANRDGPPIEVNGAEVPAVNLIAAWVEAGAPESDAFGDYDATFDQHILPLFTEERVWYPDAPTCSSCHHANLENSYHEMDLSSYEGILAGADRMEEPPGVPLLGQSAVGESDFDWEHSKLRERLRNNRMPPGMPFDITEANRDGPLVQVGYVEGTERGQAASSIDVDLTTPPDLEEVTALVQRGGCQACHIIPQIEGAVSEIGPSWCDVAHEYEEGEIDVAFLYESITSPNAEVEEGFPAYVMPQNFGELYGEYELDLLIAYIATLKCEE